jgi:hypothetical protein
VPPLSRPLHAKQLLSHQTLCQWVNNPQCLAGLEINYVGKFGCPKYDLETHLITTQNATRRNGCTNLGGVRLLVVTPNSPS